MQKSNCCNAEVSTTGGTTQFFTCINCKEACDLIDKEAYDEVINIQIKRHSVEGELDTNNISDGYHTFGELYKHRIHLFMTLCKVLDDNGYVAVKSELHDDGTSMEGWFILQLVKKGFSFEDIDGTQISYHLPIEYWDRLGMIATLPKANKWDGHTSDDVLERLLEI